MNGQESAEVTYNERTSIESFCLKTMNAPESEAEVTALTVNPATHPIGRNRLELFVLRAFDQAFEIDPEATEVLAVEFTGGYAVFSPVAYSAERLRDVLATLLMMLPAERVTVVVAPGDCR